MSGKGTLCRRQTTMACCFLRLGITHTCTSQDVGEENLLNKRYIMKKVLGSGASAKVWLAIDKQTGSQIAVKCYEKWSGSDRQFQ